MHALVGLLFLSLSASTPSPTTRVVEIKSLPGLLHPINFKQYSGFLPIDADNALHYWLVESQGRPDSDPLIVWFNGGPGCSSLGALFTEFGPFSVQRDGKTLKKNPHSWNNFANILFLESPEGVGFSYKTREVDDDTTAEHHYTALKEFFKTFPVYRNRSIFLFGGSYAGTYVPMLAEKILDNQLLYPGIGLESAALNETYVQAGQLLTKHRHGFYNETLWKKFELDCCNGDARTCNYKLLPKTNCTEKKRLKWKEPKDFNRYDVTGGCEKTDKDVLPECYNLTHLHSYLNHKAVRKTLGIPEKLPKWVFCSSEVNEKYTVNRIDMLPTVQKLLKTPLRMLLFFGDTDSEVPYFSGEIFAEKLGIKKFEAKHAVHYKGKVYGDATVYENLTLIGVHNVGHIVSGAKQAETALFVQRFLLNRPIL